MDLVENWESIEKIADALAYLKGTGSYRLKNVPKGVELRVRIGKYGYVNIFKDSEDPELIKILAYSALSCCLQCFLHVDEGFADLGYFEPELFEEGYVA